MNDETKKGSEEEYQFIEPDTSDAFAQDSKQASGGVNKGLDSPNIRRYALIALGVAVLALLGYQLFSNVFTDREIEFEEGYAEEITETLPILPDATLNRTGDVAELRREIAALAVQVDRMNQALRQVETTGGQVDVTQLTGVNNRLSQLDQTLEQFAIELAKQKQLVDNLTRARKVTSRDGESYYIQAIIPGRAWVRTREGDVLTVRVGTNIPGYGVVQMIEPQSGLVVTSTGREITYSPDDH